MTADFTDEYIERLENRLEKAETVVRAAQAYLQIHSTAEWHALKVALAAFEKSNK